MDYINKKLLFLIILILSIFIQSCKSNILPVKDPVLMKDKETDKIKLAVTYPAAFLSIIDNDYGRHWEKLLTKFNLINPSIEIESWESFIRNDKHLEELIKEDNLPDIIAWDAIFHSDYYLVRERLVEDLTDLIQYEKHKYIPAILTPQYNGKKYFIEDSVYTSPLLIVNLKLLDEFNLPVPQTYNELVKIKEVLSAKGKKTVLISMKYSGWSKRLFELLLIRFAGTEWIVNANKGIVSYNEPVFIKALTFFYKLFLTGIISKDSLSYNDEDIFKELIENNTAIMIGNHSDIIDFKRLHLNLLNQDFYKVILFPFIPGQVEDINVNPFDIVGGYGMKSSLSTAEKEAAWKFISFFTGEEAGKNLLKYLECIPTHYINKEKVKEFRTNNLIKDVYEICKKLKPYKYYFPENMTIESWSKLGEELIDLTTGNITPEGMAAIFDQELKNNP